MAFLALFLALLGCSSFASAAIVEHSFHVQNLTVNRLCRSQVITAVNGSLPGPTLRVHEGDTLIVHVLNKSPYNLTIHWHGVFQILSGWADGPEFATQCPIRPGQSYTYRFNITRQVGTLWWHAHVQWLRATVYGALVIRPRSGHDYPFPKPHREFPIILEESSLTARERRRMRNERGESKPAYNWKEEVEMKLIKKPKKRYATWTEELNLDTLATDGPQWWVVRVSRVTGHETAERMARLIARNFPDMEFKVYVPSVQIKRKLKNGTLSVKPKPLFPGCVFLRCVLNKELHDFIRECDGVGGFVGSKVGNIKHQINKPRPVDEEDIEAMFKQTKEEQEKADRAFEEEQQNNKALDSKDSPLVPENHTPKNASKRPGGRGRKAGKGTSLKLGSTVQVTAGSFAGFSGTLKKLDSKTGLATVGFTLFGKETLADIDAKEIVADAKEIVADTQLMP